MGSIRIVIEIADGVVRVTADRKVRVLVLRWDDLLAAPQPEDLGVDVDRLRSMSCTGTEARAEHGRPQTGFNSRPKRPIRRKSK